MRWICNDWMIHFQSRPTSFIGIVEALLLAYTITHMLHIRSTPNPVVMLNEFNFFFFFLRCLLLSRQSTLRDSQWYFLALRYETLNNNSNNRPDERVCLQTRNCNQLLCFLPCNTWIFTNSAAINLSICKK